MSDFKTRLEKERKRSRQIDEWVRQQDKAKNLRDRLRNTAPPGMTDEELNSYANAIICAVKDMKQLGLEDKLTVLQPGDDDAKRVAVEFYHLAVNGDQKEIVNRWRKLIEPSLASFYIEVDAWVRRRLPKELFADLFGIGASGRDIFPAGGDEPVKGGGRNSDDPNQTSVMRAKETAVTPTNKPKRSTEPGEGRTKIIAALSKHHNYAHDSCLNLEPIGVGVLARLAGVGKATCSRFFNAEFNNGEKSGHAKYRRACGDKDILLHSLKLLRQEVRPSILFNTSQNVHQLEGTDE